MAQKLSAVTRHERRALLPSSMTLAFWRLQHTCALFLHWYYHLAVSQITIDDLNDLIDRLDTAQAQMVNMLGQTPLLAGAQLSGASLPAFGAPSTLQRYRDRVLVARIPVALLFLFMVGLVLFFRQHAASDHQRSDLGIRHRLCNSAWDGSALWRISGSHYHPYHRIHQRPQRHRSLHQRRILCPPARASGAACAAAFARAGRWGAAGHLSGGPGHDGARRLKAGAQPDFTTQRGLMSPLEKGGCCYG
jgi:hypothetical protein